MAIAEPPEWEEVESVPEFRELPYSEKERIFTDWQQDRAAFGRQLGATDQDVAEFIPASTKSFQQKYLIPEVGQAQQQITALAELDVAPYRVTPQQELEALKLEAETARAQQLQAEEREDQGLEPSGLQSRSTLWRQEARRIQDKIDERTPYEPGARGVDSRDVPANPLASFFGPAVTAQAQKEMSRGMTDNAGAVAGGALGTQMLMGLRGGPLGVALPVVGAIWGAVLGGGVQEEATTLLENSPEVTAARRERTAQLQNSPEYKAGSIAAMGSLFRPSASVIRGALRGDAAAVQNIAMGGGLGVGTAAVQPILEGRMPSMNELLEGGALGLALHQPTRLAQGLFGFHPIQLKPNGLSDTVRTPIGTLDAEGRIIQPDTPEGVALRSMEGLESTVPTELQTPNIRVIREVDPTELQTPMVETRNGQTGRTVDGIWVPDELPRAPVPPSTGEGEIISPSPTGEAPPPPVDVSGERVQPPWPNADPVGIRNEFTEAERVRLGFPNRDEPIARSFPELHAEAERAFAQNPEVGRNLVEELKATPRAHTGPEAAVLTFETARQQKLVDKAYEAVNNARTPEELAKAQADLSTQAARYQDALSVSELSGTQASEALYARRLIINEDFSLARMLARERATKPDAAPLTQPEIAEVSRIHDNIKAAQENVAKAENKVADVEAEQIHKQLLKEVGRGAKSAAKEKKGVVDYFNEQAEAARKRIIARRGRLQTGDPLNLAGLVDEAIIGASHIAKGVRDFAQWSKQMLTEFGERVRPHLQDLFARSSKIEAENSKPFRTPTPAEIVAESKGAMSPKVVFDLARAHVRGGMNEMADVIKAVHADLLPTNPTLTERQVRDAFSGYGKTTFPSKEADLTTLRELKSLARLTSQLEDAQRGVAPLKTGPQRDKATARVRELQKEVNAAMRKAGINPTDPAAQLASAHTARVTRLKNTIEELQSNIAAGKRTPQTEGVPWTAEELALRDQVSVLRDQLDAVLGTPESDKLNGLLKRIEAVTEKLRTGNIEPKTGKPTVDTAAVAEAKSKLAALNKELAQARRSQRLKENPPKTEDEKKLRALEKRRDDLIAGKMKPGRKLGADTEEQALVRSQIDDLTSQIREAEQVVYNSPENRLARAKEASLARQKEIQRRIDANEYAPPVKKDKVMDRELLQSLYDEARLKEEWQHRASDQEWSRKSVWGKSKEIAWDSFNLARMMITSGDGPPILRQSLNAPTTPVKTSRAAWASMKAMFSEQQRFKFDQEIRSRENYPLYEAAGLRISQPNSKPSRTEEQFISRLLRHLPSPKGNTPLEQFLNFAKAPWKLHHIPGPVLRAAERSFSTYLNKYRADTFDAMYKLYKPGDYELSDMASVINDFTGSASLKPGGDLERAVPMFGKLLFSLRKTIADIRVGTGVPLMVGTAKSKLFALEQYARLGAGAAILMGLAKVFGLHYESDPRSSKFNQVYVPGENGQKGVWLDAWGGPAKATTLATRIIAGETRNNKGQVVPLRKAGRPLAGTPIGARGKPAFKENVGDVVTDFFKGKGSPLVSNFFQEAEQQDPMGQPLTAQGRVIKNTVPISLQQAKTIFERMGIPKGFGTQVWNFFGGGSQPAKYQPRSAIKMEPLVK